MQQASVRSIVHFISCILLYALVNPPCLVHALPTLEQLLSANESLEIAINKSQRVLVQSPATRVSVVAPELADVQILDPQQILVSGKSVGQTALSVWTEDGDVKTLDVTITWNTQQIEKVIQKLMPDEIIEVISMDDAVALRGHVSDIGLADQAVQIAEAFAPKVINLLNVPGTHQVLLQVKIAEVSTSFRNEKGFNFNIADKSIVGGSLLGGLMTSDPSASQVSMSDSVTLFFGLPKAHVAGFIQALKEEGLLHVLAEPNLIARSGETASFLVGGEFPIPVAQGGAFSNAITVEYKEFGIRLNFTPTVVTEQSIHLDISPEVSDLDFAQGLKLGGYVVPAIVTRRAHTVVKMNDGQTFAIAGLISQTKQKTTRKTPPLGNVPVFGGLFRNRELRGKETELLIMVTPHLIAPLDPNQKYRMPGDLPDPTDEEVSRADKNTPIPDEVLLPHSDEIQEPPVESSDFIPEEAADAPEYSTRHKSEWNSPFASRSKEDKPFTRKGIALYQR
ncbi:MAG: type II and III secretion system protein family protein [bacterium]